MVAVLCAPSRSCSERELARPNVLPQGVYMQTRSAALSLIFGFLSFGLRVIDAAATPRVFSTFFQAGSSITQIAADPKGNLYVLGQVKESPIPSHGIDLFVAKLNQDATAVQYFVYLGGSSTDVGDGLAVDPAGNAYIAGTTASADFPTLPRVALPAPSSPGGVLPFVAKLDPKGDVAYSIIFAGSASAVPSAIAVDSAGAAILTGYSSDTSFPATASYGSRSSSGFPFTVKLSADGARVVFSVVGVGGNAIAVDPQNNIYLSGTTTSLAYPTTPGAFQSTFTASSVCPTPPCQMQFPAGQQYVTKMAPDGGKLLYSTFLTGSSGSANSGLIVDSAGHAIVTGTTTSSDYPYTTTSASSRKDMFVTELDPTGSRVLLSIQQGGTSVALDVQGNIVVAGIYSRVVSQPQPGQGVPNPPPPEAGDTPSQCLANGSTLLTSAYVARINAQDGSLMASGIMGGGQFSASTMAVGPQGRIYLGGNAGMPDVPLTPGVPFSSAAADPTSSGIFLAAFDSSVTSMNQGLACVVDPASTSLVGPVAPGQLITLFGAGIGPAQPLTGLSTAGTVPLSLGGVSVTFDGTPAPLLYVSASQINIQVPFEVAHRSSTIMQLRLNGALIASRLFAVAPRNPSLFVTAGDQIQQCGHTGSSTLFSIVAALPDGSAASCANPALPGSSVSVFINGLGVDAVNQVTGSITGPSPPQLTVPFDVVTASGSLEADTLTDMPNAISGLGRLTFRLPNPAPKAVEVSARINGVAASPFTFSRLTQLVQMLGVLWITP